MKTHTKNSETNKILKSGTFAGGMHFVQFIFRYINAIIATRLFGAENFGIYVLTRTTSEFTSIFSGLGLHQGLLRHIPYYKAQNDNSKSDQIISFSFKLTILFSVVSSLILFFASDVIANKIFNDTTLSDTIKVISFLVPVLTLTKLIYSFLRGQKKIKQRVLLESFSYPLLLMVNILFFYFIFDNYYGLIIGFMAAHFENMLLGVFLSKFFRHIKTEKTEKKLKGEVINYSWPLLLSSSIDYLQKYTDTFMLGILSTTINVGIYTVALRLSAFVAVPLLSFNMLFSPLIAEIYSKNDIGRLKEVYTNVTKATLTMSFPIVGVIMLIPNELLLIFGKGFKDASLALIIIALGQLINVSVGASGQMLIMTGNQKLNLINAIIFLFVTVILNIIFIPKYGVVGAGLANCISLAGLNILRVVQIWRLIDITPFSLNLFKPILAFGLSIIIAFIYLNIIEQNLILNLTGASLFLIIYFSSLIIVGLDNYEKELFSNIKNKVFSK